MSAEPTEPFGPAGPRPEWTWETLSTLIEWYERKGELFAATLPPEQIRRRLRYGEAAGENTALDLLLPAAGPEAPPLLVYFHGGYWQAGSAREALYLAEPLLAAGVAMALVDYDVCPTVSMDQIVRQAAAALAWCWRHAAELGVDRRRIVAAGHSAGGHLAAELLATNFALLGADLPPCLVAGVVSFSGVFDLEQHLLRPTTEELVAHDYNAATGLDAEAARRLSPCRRVPARSVPVLLYVGGAEEAEFHRDHAALSAAWSPLLELEGTVVAGADHFGCLEALVAQPAVCARIAALCHTGR